MPLTSGSRARISLMRFASVSHCSTVIALEPTRITSSTSSRATFLTWGIASATSPACSRPDGVLAIVPPVATTLISGSLSWATTLAAASAKAQKMGTDPIFLICESCATEKNRVRPYLLPGAVVDRVFVGRAGGHEAPVARPLVGMLEALAGVGLGRGVQDARELEILQFQHAAGFLDEIVRVLRRVLVDRARRFGFGQEHLVQRGTVELVARGFAARRVRFHQ